MFKTRTDSNTGKVYFKNPFTTNGQPEWLPVLSKETMLTNEDWIEISKRAAKES